MTSTLKFKQFVDTPMGDKPVIEVAGIGPILSQRMANKGIYSASELFGRFLVMRKDRQRFQEWMRDSFGASAKQSGDCYQSLNDWCRNFMY